MEKELFDYVAERADVLATSDASTQVTKDAAEAWKVAVAADAGDEAVKAATDKLLDVLEGRPTTIDGAIAFAAGRIRSRWSPAEQFRSRWFGKEGFSAFTSRNASFSSVRQRLFP